MAHQRQSRSRPVWHYIVLTVLVLLVVLTLGRLGRHTDRDPNPVAFPEQSSDETSEIPGPATLKDGSRLDSSASADSSPTEDAGKAINGDLPKDSQSDAGSSSDASNSSDRPNALNRPFAATMSEGELFQDVLRQMPRRELVSLTTSSGNYSKIVFPERNAYSPNIIPHPTKRDWYIAIAQRAQSPGGPEEMLCEAQFQNDDFLCSDVPSKLPTAESIIGQCPDTFALLNAAPGPRDARIAFGPKAPYLVYGSLSHYTCLGLWVQDLRIMVDALDEAPNAENRNVWYKQATEIRRPEPFGVVEKNFFLFWDVLNNTYVQTDISPKRVLAKLDATGYVTENITAEVEPLDKQCMQQYLPVAKKDLGGFDHESVHLATNSLSITTCKRADTDCKPDDGNTFIMHIIHHVYGYSFHTIYEPYVVLFKQSSPFQLHAIAQKALWIRGREVPQSEDRKHKDAFQTIPHGQSEMMYVTSINWRNLGQNYHGYADDPLFIAFGIEDEEAGVIDVLAGDLLQDLALC